MSFNNAPCHINNLPGHCSINYFNGVKENDLIERNFKNLGLH